MTNNYKLPAKNTILIVDDNPANLGVLSDFLDDSGFEVWVANSGRDALEQVKYALPDLILLDVMMPEINGFETCQQLKANPLTTELPVIFMTALSDTTNKVKGLELGAVDYITKPFQQEEVLARVQLHLRLHLLTKQLAEQNLLLEQRVAERTTELTQALQNLKQAQVKLIQTEKMSSLGQLVTGVAHEINNPVNFIGGNLVHAETYIQQVLEILRLYQIHYPSPNSEIAEKVEDFDLEFLMEDLPKLTRSMKIGADRIIEIVQSLRTFSRVDEAEVKAVDIHEGINSTLMILHSRLKLKADFPGIQIIRDYQQLPLVECYPGPLNQVFMNLLSNAIDALVEKIWECKGKTENHDPFSPLIRICTRTIASDYIEIRIADNGSGMTEAVYAQLFSPFFTTKPIGKGTGVGLAISRSIIVDKHGGQLQCLSEPGQGAEFVIQIPIRQSIAPNSSFHEDKTNGLVACFRK